MNHQAPFSTSGNRIAFDHYPAQPIAYQGLGLMFSRSQRRAAQHSVIKRFDDRKGAVTDGTH